MIDDATLLRRYVESHSQEAFAELVRRHLDVVFSAALRQLGGNTHRAEDVTQRVFSDLAGKARQLLHRRSLAGWLYISAHHAAAALMRAEQRRQAREEEACIMNELLKGSGPNQPDLRSMLDEAMRELKDRDREAILLRFFEQSPFAEVGRALGLTEDSARKRVDRALDKLRAALANHGVTSTAAALALALQNQVAVAAPAGWAATVAATATAATSVGAAAPLGTVFLEFMTTTKAAIGLAGLALALTIGTALNQVLVSRQVATDGVNARAGYGAQQTRLADLQRQFEALDRERTLLQSRRAKESIAAAAPEKSAVVGKPVPPALQKAFEETTRARFKKQFANLFVALRLSPVEIDRFLSAITVPEFLTTTNGNDQRINSLPIDSADYEAGLKDALGKAGYQQFMEFQRTEAFCELAGQVAAQALAAGSSLTAAQVGQLTQVLANNNQGSRNRMGPATYSFGWSDVIQQAGAFLSADQLARLDAVRQNNEYAIELKAAAYPEFEKNGGGQ